MKYLLLLLLLPEKHYLQADRFELFMKRIVKSLFLKRSFLMKYYGIKVLDVAMLYFYY